MAEAISDDIAGISDDPWKKGVRECGSRDLKRTPARPARKEDGHQPATYGPRPGAGPSGRRKSNPAPRRRGLTDALCHHFRLRLG